MPLLVLLSSPLVSRRYVLVTPARIFKLQPFRNVKRDFCRTPSIGFNGHRYSNLFDGGSSSFNPSLPALLLCSYLFSLFLFDLRAFSPQRKPLHVTGGVGKGTGKKRICILLVFFPPSVVDTRGLDLERKSRRQMRASARGNCSPSIFRVPFSSPEDLDLEKRCRITRSFDANKSLEADTMGAPIFIEMRHGSNGDLIGRFDD